MTLRLGDFAGTWRVRREIRDGNGGPDGLFRGRAEFVPDGAVLIYRERGVLALDGAEMEAEQVHHWRQDGSVIRVSFADERPFHAFDAASREPTARHDCAPDLYEVSYAFGDWPEWRTEWIVSGPRKDYAMRTRYRRA